MLESVYTNSTKWNISDKIAGVERNQNYNGFDCTAQTYNKFYLAYVPSGYSNPITLTLPMWQTPGSTLSTDDNTYHFTVWSNLRENIKHYPTAEPCGNAH